MAGTCNIAYFVNRVENTTYILYPSDLILKLYIFIPLFLYTNHFPYDGQNDIRFRKSKRKCEFSFPI